MDISFILPVYNEEKHIASTVASIQSAVVAVRECLERELTCEIIVVDNGSTDQTRAICEAMGVHLFVSHARTVGGVRNAGAQLAKGALFIFVDGDVILSDDWAQHFPVVWKMVNDSKTIISGSKVQPAGAEQFLARNWFQGRGTLNYMNSAHLIVHREFFEQLGGFDELLVSGEDSDFSRRALLQGGIIRPVQELRVVHQGSPADFRAFFKRERWHGYGDFQSWGILSKSKPAHMAIANLGVGIAIGVAALVITPWTLLIYPGALICLSTVAAFYRVGYRFEVRIVPLIMIYAVYITARTLSLIDFLVGVRPERWR